MTNKKVWTGVAVVVLAAIILLIAFKPFKDDSPGEHDAFAQCLTDSGVKMYGTDWCPHCKAQKALFGKKSFKLVDYINCDKEREECLIKGVQGYPTWIFPDGEKIPGQTSLEHLSEVSGCEL